MVIRERVLEGARMFKHVIAMGVGREATALLFTDARLVNVFSGNVETTLVAVGHGVIVGIGSDHECATLAEAFHQSVQTLGARSHARIWRCRSWCSPSSQICA
jgi:adenine deaminase